MAIKKYLPKKEWQQRIREWKASGKGAKAWCQEKSIAYTTFITWRRRLTAAEPLQHRDAPFVELTPIPQSNSTLTLECTGIKIHLSADFDEALLVKCLTVLRGAIC